MREHEAASSMAVIEPHLVLILHPSIHILPVNAGFLWPGQSAQGLVAAGHKDAVVASLGLGDEDYGPAVGTPLKMERIKLNDLNMHKVSGTTISFLFFPSS